MDLSFVALGPDQAAVLNTASVAPGVGGSITISHDGRYGALQGKAVAVEDPELRALLGPSIPVVGYMPSGTSLLAKKLGAAMRPDADAYLMAKHGVLCCGADIEAASRKADSLEAFARRLLAQRIEARARKAGAQASALQRLLDALHAA